MLSFLINLDRSKERLATVSKRLAELGIRFERVSAVDGNTLSEAELDKYLYPVDHFPSKVRFTRSLARGEVGCFLSHRKCWQQLVDSKDRWAMCLEDDVWISDLAAPYMGSDAWIPEKVNLCQLSCSFPRQKGRILETTVGIDDCVKLVRPISPSPLGTLCYFISREAAQRALVLSEKLPAPVDNFLFSPWFDMANEFEVWRTDPVLVTQSPSVDSEITGRSKKEVTKAPFWIRHGLTRFLLDRKIKKMQAQGHPFEFVFRAH